MARSGAAPRIENGAARTTGTALLGISPHAVGLALILAGSLVLVAFAGGYAFIPDARLLGIYEGVLIAAVLLIATGALEIAAVVSVLALLTTFSRFRQSSLAAQVRYVVDVVSVCLIATGVLEIWVIGPWYEGYGPVSTWARPGVIGYAQYIPMPAARAPRPIASLPSTRI